MGKTNIKDKEYAKNPGLVISSSREYAKLSDERDHILKQYGKKSPGPCEREVRNIMEKAVFTSGLGRDGVMYKGDEIDSPQSFAWRYGMETELNAKIIQVAREEVENGINGLRELLNEVTALNRQVMPILIGFVKSLRDNRMTCTMEMKKILTDMKDFRAWYMDKDYRTEMDRMKEYADMAERILELHKSGVVDIISDVLIKLQVGGTENDEGEGKGEGKGVKAGS